MPYPATRRGARAGRLPSGGPQHAARASRIAAPPGPRPASNFSQPTTQFSARSSSGAPPGARLWRSLRSEAGDSANRAIRSRPDSPPKVRSFRPVAHFPEAATRLGRQGRRFSEPQEHSPFTAPFSKIRPRCASPAIPMESRYSFSKYILTPVAIQSQRRAQRAPSSCSPPPAGAADCATQRVAKAKNKIRPTVRPVSPPPARPSAARKPQVVFAPGEQL